MEQLLQGLNDAQRSAVTSEANVLQVLAPPGSGKTKTLTARVSYLITQCGLKPWNIIVCTFTVKAAREMKERIKELVGNGLEKKLILGTFHSVSRRFLVTYGQHIGIDKNFGIADSSDTKAIIKRIIKDNQLTIEPSKAISRISSNKAKNISSEQFAATAKKADEEEFTIVYSEYESALKTSNLLDYDDLLVRCAFLLRSHPQCVSNIQAVLIDEFQDTNEVQFDLMRLFAQQQRTITIVGDPDQSIYGWRNAEIKNLERMKKLYPDTLVIFLEENYRSSGAILQSAQIVIEQDESRPDKRLQATHVRGEQPILRKIPTANAEAQWLVNEIRRTQALTGKMLQYSDFAILLRSAPLSRHIEQALGHAGIPYRMVGGTKFYDRVEVKIVLDYLRVMNQPDHNDAVLRILNVPSRSLGEVTVKTLLDESQRKAVPLWSFILGIAQGKSRRSIKLSSQAEKGLTDFANVILTGRKKMTGSEEKLASPVEMVDFLIKRLEFDKYLRRKYPEDHEARWANIEELKAQTADLSSAIARGDDLVEEEALPAVDGLDQRTVSSNEDALAIFLANIALANDVQKKNEESAEQTQCVTISTIHAAKGLEWPVVFIPACYQGSIPHSRAEDNDEERRLLYVGMTRAQAILYLSCPMKNSQTQETTMSHFLTQNSVEAHFHQHGPALEFYAVGQIALTLRRDCPDYQTIQDCKFQADLGDLEDNHWPHDGTWPVSENEGWNQSHETGFGMVAQPYGFKRPRNATRSVSPARATGFVSASTITIQRVETFSTSSSTLKPSYVTAASRAQEYEELQEAATMKKLDKRSLESTSGKSKKGPKIAVGAASIASYFGQPAGSKAQSQTPSPAKAVPVVPARVLHKSYSAPHDRTTPLGDITNSAPQATGELPRPPILPTLLSHKPRTAANHMRPRKETVSRSADYVFLSSSPPQAEGYSVKKVKLEPEMDVVEALDQRHTEQTQSGYRPASTFHTTSMSQIGTAARGTGRKTLGMGRTFKPWSARGGKT